MKVLLLPFSNAESGPERIRRLASLGFEVAVEDPRWPAFFHKVKEVVPDAVAVGCFRLPSHARETASYLGQSKATREVPLFLINVAEKDLAKTAQKAPRARIVTEAELATHRLGQ